MRIVRVTAAALALFAVLAITGPAAAAEGSELYPVADRYEPGEVANLVGYTGPGAGGSIEDGPYYAYLSALGDDAGEVELGELTLNETGHEGWRALRASLSFTVPDDLEAGIYAVHICNDPCTVGLGDLVGGTVSIGVDPEVPIVRVWPLDEPEIANLADDAVIAGPGYEASVAVIRAGDFLLREPAPAPATPPGPATPAPPVVVPPPSAPPPEPVAAHAPPPSRGWLVFGSSFAALCVLSVLLALRQSVPATRMANP